MKSANQIIYRGHIPYVRFLLSLLLGIAMGVFMPVVQAFYPVLNAMIGGLIISFIVLFLVDRDRVSKLFSWMGLIWSVILVLVGWVSVWKSDPHIDRTHFSRHDSSIILGYISDEPTVRGAHVRFPLTVTGSYDNDTLNFRSGQMLLTIRLDSTGAHDFAYGRVLVIPGTYERVAPPYNPGELDYRRYLENKNTWHQAYIRDVGEVRLLAGFQGSRLVSYALQLRQRMVAKFGKHLDDQDALSIASTLILGYRADLSQELLNAFSATGTIHVLSVSGMHVVIVFWLLSKMLWWMDRTKGLRFGRWLLMLSCVWAYALITGFSPSVLRASIMISFVITARHFSRQARVYNSIAASAFFLLLYNPKFILDVGFQLSYLAVLFIVFLMPVLQRALPVKQRIVRPVWDYSLMSISAQAGAFPLATFYFNQFPMYFLPANLLIVIPASFIMYLGFALLLLPFEAACRWVGLVLERLILVMNDTLFYIEQLPFANLRGVWLASWEYIALYVLMLSLVFALLSKRKGLVYLSLTCLSLLLFSSFWAMNGKVTERQAVIYNVRGNLAIGIVDRGNVVLYTNLQSLDDRTLQYSVVPHLEYYTSEHLIGVVEQDSTYQSGSVFIHSGVIQCDNQRLFVYEGEPTFESVLPVDILLLRGNPSRPLAEIIETTPCSLLVIDGSNYDNTIERIQTEAEELEIPVYVLKNNYAYVWAYSD